MRYSKEFKLKCIKHYLNGENIKDPPGVHHSSFNSQVRCWARIYKQLGEDGFKHGRPTLSIDQRLDGIYQVEQGKSYSEVSASYGIQAELLMRWHKVYLEKGEDGLKSIKRGRPSMKNKTKLKPTKNDSDKTKKELLEDIEYLKAENAYLKKLKALVQKREAQEPKKK